MSIFLLGQVKLFKKIVNLRKLLGNNDIVRSLSSSFKNEELDKKHFKPFLQVMKDRQNEAKRSIVVQVQSTQSSKELYSYCNSFGQVKNMLHYSSGVEPLHFIVVEFAEEQDVDKILKESSHIVDGVPIYSQFLWFKAPNKRLPKLKQAKNVQLLVENGTNIIQDAELKEKLLQCENISDQMMSLYELTRLSELGSRLRFLTARQVEVAVSGMFPLAKAFLFGSSVNGFGKMGCDLDLVLKLSQNPAKDDSRLVFHCKTASGSDRSTSQRHMEVLGDLIHLFLPGCAQVRRILQARVPIIKFHQQLTDVECDLSMSNMSGVHMSDFLFIMGSIDCRVCPLIFTVRKWAREVGLTNASPGRWISNFSLTLLVLAFLQNPINSPPILPSLNTLTKHATPEDNHQIEEGITCNFLRDITKLKTKTTNTSSLEELLTEFFEFYSQFDFASKAVCLNEPVSLTKPDYSAMYIVNPIERGLNVSKNVSQEEVDRFKAEVRNAAWALESQEELKTTNWGITGIFESKRRVQLFPAKSSRRLMDVSTLFNEGEENHKEILFKDDKIKQQVVQIKRETEMKINELDRRKSNR